MAAVAVLSAMGSLLPNPFAVFPCTTKAYGFPFPWKIAHCLCEKGRIEYAVWGAIGNVAVVIAAACLLVRWIIRNKPRDAAEKRPPGG
ncbi:MAG: hypothetical protein JW940_13800 [Polyangiaceae bacterium]|nr:hypothetical protein [Polyangiaceae bacterium]